MLIKKIIMDPLINLYTADQVDILLLLLNKIGSATLRESGKHPISLKTPAPLYQPIDKKKRKGKKVEN